MNRITRIVIGIALALSSACNYLDVVPEDNATLDDAFKSQDKALSYLFSIYGHLPNNIQYWMPGQPCGGDDLAVAVKGTTRWFCYKSMVYGEESASTVYHNFMRHSGAPTGGVNYDYYSAIRYAYTFLDRIQQVPDISETNLREWQGEAWYLIGYFHWALLEYYGPIVIMDHEISLNADETELYKPRNTFDECVDFIVECFDKAIEMLPPRQQNIRWYGRASAAAAHGFKVRTLLFAASPLFNGNSEFFSRLRNSDGTYLVSQTYDPAKWERARIAAEQAISYAEQNGYRLYENPANASIADNFERGVRNFHDYFVEPEYNTDEYLCAYVHTEGPKKIQRLSGIRTELPYSADDFTTSYQVMFPAVEMYYTKNGLPLADDPTIDLTTLYDYDPDTQVANINQNREPRFYACVGYNRGEFEIANEVKQVQAYAGEVHGYILKNDGSMNSSVEYVNSSGYFLKKPVHRTTAYDKTTKTFSYKKFVYPVIRLAELYLSYAEADFEYNGKLSAQSLEYLNKVRSRCGLPDFEESWQLAGGMPTGSKLRQVLHMERNNELMFEGHRYRDMRRWKEADKCMNATWKAWNVWGKNAAEYYTIKDFKDFDRPRKFETPRHYLLPYPIEELQINENLVQNPGW